MSGKSSKQIAAEVRSVYEVATKILESHLEAAGTDILGLDGWRSF